MASRQERAVHLPGANERLKKRLIGGIKTKKHKGLRAITKRRMAREVRAIRGGK